MGVGIAVLIFASLLPVAHSVCSCGNTNFPIALPIGNVRIYNPQDDVTKADCATDCTYTVTYTPGNLRLVATFVICNPSTNSDEMLTIYDGPAANNIILGSTNCVDGGGSPNISSTSSITIVLKAPTPASATPATFFLAISPTAANAPTTTTNQPITTPLNNGSSTCDTTKLNQCTQSFFKNFGTSQIPYSNETVFEMAFFNFLNVQGVDGWRQIREWMHTLITCTGGHHSFEACYNWNFLQTAWNIDVQNAKQWNIRLLNLDYDCGPGYEVMLQNFYCIEGVAAHEGPVIKSCQQTLQNEQNNQPNMTCQHVAEYLTCIERPYVTHCGRDAGGLICYGERIAYNIYFPQCTSQVALHCRNAPGKK